MNFLEGIDKALEGVDVRGEEEVIGAQRKELQKVTRRIDESEEESEEETEEEKAWKRAGKEYDSERRRKTNAIDRFARQYVLTKIKTDEDSARRLMREKVHFTLWDRVLVRARQMEDEWERSERENRRKRRRGMGALLCPDCLKKETTATEDKSP